LHDFHAELLLEPRFQSDRVDSPPHCQPAARRELSVIFVTDAQGPDTRERLPHALLGANRNAGVDFVGVPDVRRATFSSPPLRG
jgi:hypothetical protein